MRISDWSSDVCSSDLDGARHCPSRQGEVSRQALAFDRHGQRFPVSRLAQKSLFLNHGKAEQAVDWINPHIVLVHIGDAKQRQIRIATAQNEPCQTFAKAHDSNGYAFCAKDRKSTRLNSSHSCASSMPSSA